MITIAIAKGRMQESALALMDRMTAQRQGKDEGEAPAE